MTDFILILVTAESVEEAQKIAAALMEEKLVACANIVPGVKSRFFWKGKVESADEVLIILKTRETHFQRIAEIVKEKHSYEVPEIVAFNIAMGDEKYLNWIHETTS